MERLRKEGSKSKLSQRKCTSALKISQVQTSASSYLYKTKANSFRAESRNINRKYTKLNVKEKYNDFLERVSELCDTYDKSSISMKKTLEKMEGEWNPEFQKEIIFKTSKVGVSPETLTLLSRRRLKADALIETDI